MPTQVPVDDSDSDATQPGDAAEEPQPELATHTDDAGDAELPEAEASAPPREPVSRSASPAVAGRGLAGGEAADGKAQVEKLSPFAAAKAALRQRQIEAAAAAAAPRPAAVDPYDFPETQDAAGQLPAAAAQPAAAPAAAVSAVPESDDAPTSREKTPPAVPAAAASPAAPELPEGPEEPEEHADSPDQQSQHVPKATARRGAPTATEAGNELASIVSNVCS
jgi:hypothetical protein